MTENHSNESNLFIVRPLKRVRPEKMSMSEHGMSKQIYFYLL